MKRQVLMLTNSHSPFDQRVFQKEAKTLVTAGYDVTLATPLARGNFQKDGVNFISVPEARGGLKKLIVCPWNLFRTALRFPRTTLIQLHDSELLVIGFLLKIAGRVVIYDAHEDTPLQISYFHWVPRLLKKPYAWFYYWLEKLAGRFFDAIIIAEPVIGKYFPGKKTFLVRNFPVVDAFRRFSGPAYPDRKSTLVYVGLLSHARGLKEMLKGANLAREKVEFDFMLGGKFSPPTLEKDVVTTYPVKYLSWLEFDQMIALLFDSRIGIIVPQPNERYKTNYPVKLFEYWSAGLPVIASREGESAAFVNESNSGILVNPLDENEIANAVVWLFEHPTEAEAMGKRGQQMIFNKYNWENEVLPLLSAFDYAVN